MTNIEPTEAQVGQFLSGVQDETKPVVMVNLLKFRAQAIYSDHPNEQPCSGIDAYRKYLESTFPIIEAMGGRVVYSGSVELMMIGADTTSWDQVLLVEYPNKAAFLGMGMSEEYKEALHHRKAGLEDTRLWVTQEKDAL